MKQIALMVLLGLCIVIYQDCAIKRKRNADNTKYIYYSEIFNPSNADFYVRSATSTYNLQLSEWVKVDNSTVDLSSKNMYFQFKGEQKQIKSRFKVKWIGLVFITTER